MNKKKTYTAPACLVVTLNMTEGMLAGSPYNIDLGRRDSDTGTDAGEFKSSLNINDVWE